MEFTSYKSVPNELQELLANIGEVVDDSSPDRDKLVPIAWQKNDGSISFLDDFGTNPTVGKQALSWNSTQRLPFLKVGIDIAVSTEFGVLVIFDDRMDFRRFPGGRLNFYEINKIMSAVERKIFEESLYIIRKDKTARLIPRNINSEPLNKSIDYLDIKIERFERVGYLKYLGYSVDHSSNQLNFVFGWDITEYEIPVAVFHKKDFADGSFASYSLFAVNERLELTCDTSGQHGFIKRKVPSPGEDFHTTVIDYFQERLLNDITVV